MNVDFQRRIDRWVGTALCRFLSMLPGARTEPSPGPRRRILVILLSEMGALVLARPMFERIRANYPDASVHVLLFEQNREVLALLDVVPDDNVLTIRNTSLAALLADSLRHVRRLRRLRIDTVVDGELFSRFSSLLSFLSGATTRVGFDRYYQEGLYRGDFINRPVLYNPYQHISHQFVTLVEAIESSETPTVKRIVPHESLQVPRFEPPASELSAMKERLKRDFPRVSGKRLVLMYPGGGLLPIRAWPLGHFQEVARSLVEKDYAVGIVGLSRDKGRAEEIVAACDGEACIDLTGYTRTVRELTLVFFVASLLIANDGGPGHFASLTPIPAVILYGPETPVLYGSLDGKAVNLHTNLSCSPCLTAYNHRRSPCNGNNVCLKAILPEEVLGVSSELLDRHSGQPI